MANHINWIGIDDHADRWTICHFAGNEERAKKEFELMAGESGYRKLIGWLKEMQGEVRVVYEAGPCGYEMYRRLGKAGIRCDVAAPSLTPRKPGDRVKTNRRDALKLARLHRANELTSIVVPDEAQEATRDLIRARESVCDELLRVRHQISKLLLRYGYRYREGKAWTQRFDVWLRAIQLKQADSQLVLVERITTLDQKTEQLARFDKLVEEAARRAEYTPYVEALSVLRGISTLTAMTILVELGDLRRFATAPQLMAAIGVVPAEDSTGDKTRKLGITKTGNAHVRRVLVEAAWHYQRRATAGVRIQARRKGKPQRLLDIAVKCDLRLNKRFNRLTSRGKRSTVAVVAVARELAGFIWAIGQAGGTQ